MLRRSRVTDRHFGQRLHYVSHILVRWDGSPCSLNRVQRVLAFDHAEGGGFRFPRVWVRGALGFP